MNGQNEIHIHLDGVEKIVEAILAQGISKEDRALLERLNHRAERIARKLSRLDARTPEQKA